MKIKWTEPAEKDLEELFLYIARDAEFYAEQFVEKLVETTNILIEQPKLGRKVPEADREDLRELIFQGYRIIYLIADITIYVVTVIHGSRDLENQSPPPWLIS